MKPLAAAAKAGVEATIEEEVEAEAEYSDVEEVAYES
jgi:hypothetical protein